MPHSFPTRRSSDLARVAASRPARRRPARRGPQTKSSPVESSPVRRAGALEAGMARKVTPGAGGRLGKVCDPAPPDIGRWPCDRSEEHTSELQSLMRISYAVFCLKKKNHKNE